ncbi:multicomponent Na+:H+ antiporter subunit E [Arcanobacterium pluranimalium]|uniref:Na+/H+ antiporter subunit E n=1 Tax=Arcanobacterium pluranimalium TaxID=108028 RepID=UPI00195A5608|nr:Na+/H+ antiporter subunit E [Arcanobacterium pluranimalium]MBM7824290.1 multicomponent Na+:H+ antiporter subunit E [Arcanobacterium pluranimalium]
MTKAAETIKRATRRPGRFPHASMGMLVWLTIAWVMLWGDFTTGNFLAGFLVALLVTTVAPFPTAPFDGRFRPWGVVRLVAIFLWDIVRASWIQAAFILRRRRPRGAIIRVQLRSHSDVYRAMVAGMTGLVPGSVVVDSHQATGTLYVHVFDTELAGGIAGVHQTLLEQEERVLRAFASHDELVAAGYVPGSSPSAGKMPTPYAPETLGARRTSSASENDTNCANWS